MNQNTAVEKLAESLSFEVEAVPQENIPQYKSTSHITPVNVKVRVRKKDKAGVQKGTICIPKVARTDHHPERIRLASSDQTIMSFNVLMEDPDNRKSKKKSGFGSCLAGTTEDEDDEPYMPKNEATGSKTGHKQKLALSKTGGNQFAPGDVGRKHKRFFGPCKPGGCLDPPFGEDRYQYLPPDSKKPKRSTDNKIDTKIPEHESNENQGNTTTPIDPPIDSQIDKKQKEDLLIDNNFDKKPSKCSNTNNKDKDDTTTQKCPSFDYKVDPNNPPLRQNFGNAAKTATGYNTTGNDLNYDQHKKKRSSSDPASTPKISKIPSGSSNSIHSLYKGKSAEPRLEDKESNSIITYAEDEDDMLKERMNKNRKSSASANRTSFDLNAPYYTRPKRDISQDLNERKEKLRRSFEPLSKSQDETSQLPDEKDAFQKTLLQMGINLEIENDESIGEYGQSGRTEDAIRNKEESLSEQEKGIDKLKAYMGIPQDQHVNKDNYRDVDSHNENYMKSGTPDKNHDENVSSYKKYDTNEKIKPNDFASLKDFEKQSESYANICKQSNSFISDTGTGTGKNYENKFNTQTEIDNRDLKKVLRSGTDNKNVENDFDTQSEVDSNELKKILSSGSGSENKFDTQSEADGYDPKKIRSGSGGKNRFDTEYEVDSYDLKNILRREIGGENKFDTQSGADSYDLIKKRSGSGGKNNFGTQYEVEGHDPKNIIRSGSGGENKFGAQFEVNDHDLTNIIRSGSSFENKFDAQTKADSHSLIGRSGGPLDQDIYSNKGSDIKHTESSSEIFKRGHQLDLENDDYGSDKRNSLRDVDRNKNLEYNENKRELKPHDTDTERHQYKFDDRFDNKDIVTLKARSFDKDISDAESDYKVTDSRSSLNRNYDTKDKTAAAHRAADMETPTLIKSPIAKIDIISKEKIDADTITSSHGVNSNSSKYSHRGEYESGSISTLTDKSTRTRISDDISRPGQDAKKLATDVSMDLAFQNSFDGTQRILRTLETPLNSKIQTDPNIIVIQKRLTLDGDRTRLSIDPETDMTIQLNRRSTDHHHHEKDHHHSHKGILLSDDHATHSHHQHNLHQHVTFSSVILHENLSHLYEKELVPLQNMIKNLKAEIDALAGQHRHRERALETHKRLKPVRQCTGTVMRK